MAQRDPLVEYQREGFTMFNAMNEAVREEAVGYVFHLEVKTAEPTVQTVEGASDIAVVEAASDEPVAAAPAAATKGKAPVKAAPVVDALGLEEPERPSNLQYSAPSEDGSAFVSGSPRAGAPRRTAATADDAGEESVNREDRRRAAKQAKKR